ncbi:ATP12 family chaperone protein [Magnetospirillum sulfuroxidans]|uniref:ATPase n=1 Tax=Magnetospirillum sulfuroxidans TaxID=611300 RepID=A0ABS5IET5_9PROT|nr:ATP12 family protein [Magnetospirillum sulfuroxidans]MBR9972926.1 ATPase [Magnetospirillum sulfuroxidans]
MLGKTIKRFHKQAGIAASDAGFAVQLDGRGVKTPAGRALQVPSEKLAWAIAAEWDAQDGEIKPYSMPLTQLASTALDRVGPERAVIVDQMVAYAATDLLCYRAESPSDLVALQTREWQPLLDWSQAHLAAGLRVTTGVIAIDQPAAALTALRARLDGYDLWRLTVAQAACSASGSLVLALALTEGRLSGEECFTASNLDEAYQMALWGDDYEAADRRAELLRDIQAAADLLSLV